VDLPLGPHRGFPVLSAGRIGDRTYGCRGVRRVASLADARLGHGRAPTHIGRGRRDGRGAGSHDRVRAPTATRTGSTLAHRRSCARADTSPDRAASAGARRRGPDRDHRRARIRERQRRHGLVVRPRFLRESAAVLAVARRKRSPDPVPS